MCVRTPTPVALLSPLTRPAPRPSGDRRRTRARTPSPDRRAGAGPPPRGGPRPGGRGPGTGRTRRSGRRLGADAGVLKGVRVEGLGPHTYTVEGALGAGGREGVTGGEGVEQVVADPPAGHTAHGQVVAAQVGRAGGDRVRPVRPRPRTLPRTARRGRAAGRRRGGGAGRCGCSASRRRRGRPRAESIDPKTFVSRMNVLLSIESTRRTPARRKGRTDGHSAGGTQGRARGQ